MGVKAVLWEAKLRVYLVQSLGKLNNFLLLLVQERRNSEFLKNMLKLHLGLKTLALPNDTNCLLLGARNIWHLKSQKTMNNKGKSKRKFG
ncbi:hypothetical protein MKW98_024240 [Papaver atlanticum]|uniref:Uncharacterized protein n=1 Tax=Papaver atlanticum TaxID=357466 RepID=A0AAD4XN25_9MAGN|nr:hypothetical protein MKW98_024240 [Papaver atlanticum]